MRSFNPTKIYLEASVTDHPVAHRIINKFKNIPCEVITDRKEIKTPLEITHAKKTLFLSKHRGNALRQCQGSGGDYVCCGYHTISLVTDCHLECTYCILQDYLKNNPVITIFVNIEEVLEEIRQKVIQEPHKIFRLGPGELSDTLALDGITEYSRELVKFANDHPNVIVELKTKTACIDNFINLNHNKNIVASWSVNPQKYIEKEELKCAPLEQRLNSARLCADKGFLIGFHFDPILGLKGWNTEYKELINMMADRFKDDELAWISLGTLRFTPELKKINQERFPASTIMSGELFPNDDGKVRYFRPLREEMYHYIVNLLTKRFATTPLYLCMETKPVWRNVFGFYPKNNEELEKYITKKFVSQSKTQSQSCNF